MDLSLKKIIIQTDFTIVIYTPFALLAPANSNLLKVVNMKNDKKLNINMTS